MEEQALVPTPAGEWQGKVEMEGSDLLLPSGNVARIKQISPSDFLGSGMIPDPLTNIIRQAIHSKKGLPPSTLKKVADDPEMLASTLRMFDEVLSTVAVAPVILMPPKCIECGEYYNNGQHTRNEPTDELHPYQEGVRKPNALYADQVVLEDKMFVFQWCLGGTRDLEKFHSQQRASVGDILGSEGVQRSPKRSPRRK